jgi:hypothetical protein
MYSRIDSTLGLMPVDNSKLPSVIYQSPLEPPNWHGKSGQVFADSQNNLWIYDVKYTSWILTGCVKLTEPSTLTVQGHGISFTMGCHHKWKLYEGFTDRFEYCETCNERKI